MPILHWCNTNRIYWTTLRLIPPPRQEPNKMYPGWPVNWWDSATRNTACTTELKKSKKNSHWDAYGWVSSAATKALKRLTGNTSTRSSTRQRRETIASLSEGMLTHWGRDKMPAVSQTTLSNPFSWMKIFAFRLEFHWSLFLRFQLTQF